jgi:hypothetical protein
MKPIRISFFAFLFAFITMNARAQNQPLYSKPMHWENHEQWKDTLLAFFGGKYTMFSLKYFKKTGSADIFFQDKENHKLRLELSRYDDPNGPLVGSVDLSGYGDDVLRFYQQFIDPKADIAKIRSAANVDPLKKGAYSIKLKNEYANEWQLEADITPQQR